MKIRSQLVFVSVLFTSLVVFASWTGWQSVLSLGRALEFVTGRAWDAADGAMEASISVANQMLAVETRVTAARTPREKARAEQRLEQAEEFGRSAVERLIASDLFEAKDEANLKKNLSDFEAARQVLFLADDRWDASYQVLLKGFEKFQQLMVETEEFGDGQIEDLEAHPDQELSWNQGIRDRWLAADGAMEAQIHLLERFYTFQVLVARISDPDSSADQSQREVLGGALEKLQGKLGQLLSLSVYRETAATGRFQGATWAKRLEEAFESHRREFAQALQDLEDYKQSLLSYRQKARAFLEFLEPFEEVGDSKVEGEMVRIQATISSARWRVLLVTLAAFLLCALAGLYGWIYLGSPLEATALAARKFAAGELEVALPIRRGDDELGILIGALDEMIEQVRNRQTSLANLAGRHARGLSETSTTLQELNQTLLQTNEIAKSVQQNSDRSLEAGTRGVEAANRIEASMKELSVRIEESTGTFENLTGEVRKIESILEAVNDLAEQSKFLSLNAAIEAARASEHGKGFGVVAVEVRNLANQSQDATHQIREILQGISDSSDRVVQTIRGARDEAQVGQRLATESRAVIEDLQDSIEESRMASTAILRACEEQVTGADRITLAVGDLASAAQEMQQVAAGASLPEASSSSPRY